MRSIYIYITILKFFLVFSYPLIYFKATQQVQNLMIIDSYRINHID